MKKSNFHLLLNTADGGAHLMVLTVVPTSMLASANPFLGALASPCTVWGACVCIEFRAVNFTKQQGTKDSGVASATQHTSSIVFLL